MNLKESFRYQNYLDTLFNQCASLLRNDRQMTTVTQNHMRSKVNHDADDEVIIAEKPCSYNCSNDDLMRMLVFIINERQKVADAVHKAKCSSDFACDAALSVNKYVQTAAHVFAALGQMKASERTIRGTGYKFNAEGNQVSYNYDVKETVTIDYDRNTAKAMSKAMYALADKVSMDADKFVLETNVEHEPVFNVNYSFEDAIEAYLAIKEKEK